MGIYSNMLDLVDLSCKSTGIKIEGCNMCELGDQFMCGFDDDPSVPKIAKTYFENIGVKHTSIDIGGQNGSLKLNLSKPLNDFSNYFDLITNYGTSEHVSDQYNLFLNIHNFVRVGGAIINVAPLVGSWQDHPCFFFYESDFFNILSEKNEYKIIYNEIKYNEKKGGIISSSNKLICNVAVKKYQSDFVSRSD